MIFSKNFFFGLNLLLGLTLLALVVKFFYFGNSTPGGTLLNNGQRLRVSPYDSDNIKVPPAKNEIPNGTSRLEFVVVSDLKDEGQSTPTAALKSSIYYALNDKNAKLRDAFRLSSASESKLQNYWSGLSLESKRDFSDPHDLLVAAFSAEVLKKVYSIRIVSLNEILDGTARIEVESQGASVNGRLSRTVFNLDSQSGTWRIKLPEEVIEYLPIYLNQINRREVSEK